MKKLLGILLTFVLVFTMSGAVYAAADGTSDISAYNGNTESTQAEIMAANKSTIKKENGKWYYYNGKGKKDTGKGWKKNSSGKLAYYVGGNGYVTMKIVKSKKDGVTRTYKFANGEWNNNETKYTAKKKNIKEINGKCFYIDGNGRVDRAKGWKKNKSGKPVYYVDKSGYVTKRINNKHFQKWNGTEFKNETPAPKSGIKKIGGKYYYFTKNGNISTVKGWKKDSSGKLAYFVGEKGYVTAKITSGKYYEWSKTALTKVNNLPKNKIVKKKGKWFYVNGKGKIDLTTGWKNEGTIYVNGGEVQVNKAVKIDGKTYYFDKNGSEKKLNDGWNGSVYVKNGEPVIGTTVQVDGFYNTFDDSGNRVSYVVKNGKIVRSDNGKSVSKTGAYKIGSGSNKEIYYCTKSDGTYQTSGSVTINGKMYEVESSGICVLHEVHQWSPLDENGQLLEDTDKKSHAAKTEIQDVKVKDAWNEEIKSDTKKYICKKCNKYYDTLDEWYEHSDATNHGNYERDYVVVNTIPHKAVYKKQEVIVEEAWEEWIEHRRCSVCGEMMEIHRYKGFVDDYGTVSAFIPNKSGDLVTVSNKYVRSIEANKPYNNSLYVGKYEYLNETDKSYLILLSNHNIGY